MINYILIVTLFVLDVSGPVHHGPTDDSLIWLRSWLLLNIGDKLQPKPVATYWHLRHYTASANRKVLSLSGSFKQFIAVCAKFVSRLSFNKQRNIFNLAAIYLVYWGNPFELYIKTSYLCITWFDIKPITHKPAKLQYIYIYNIIISAAP